jgi:hypothetical protein
MYALSSALRASGPNAGLALPKPFALLVALAMIVVGAPAHADVTLTDLQIAARALSFVSDPLSGKVRIGIVYASDSPRSVSQAQQLRGMLADGMRIGTLELRPVLLESREVAAADVDLYFLTEYILTDATPPLPGGSARRKVLCVTTDIEQVQKGACVMGVRSRPKVEVFVNRAAAAANDVTFSTVFRVMITEL